MYVQVESDDGALERELSATLLVLKEEADKLGKPLELVNLHYYDEQGVMRTEQRLAWGLSRVEEEVEALSHVG